jgi:MarR family transcriptional regulator, temperature-dependent positive regulator of motility
LAKIHTNLDESLSEIDLMILIDIEKNIVVNQRAMAKKYKVSLGKINYCIKSLAGIGYIKIDNFVNSENKLKYLYLITPKGIAAKALLTRKFLQIKLNEYNNLLNLTSES